MFNRSNHTKHFWRNRQRAHNELKALKLIEPELESIYAVGGVLEPVGVGFSRGCLQDERSENGTTASKYFMRAAVEVGREVDRPWRSDARFMPGWGGWGGAPIRSIYIYIFVPWRPVGTLNHALRYF